MSVLAVLFRSNRQTTSAAATSDMSDQRDGEVPLVDEEVVSRVHAAVTERE